MGKKFRRGGNLGNERMVVNDGGGGDGERVVKGTLKKIKWGIKRGSSVDFCK